MEIFIGNLQYHARTKSLKNQLRPRLEQFGIFAFELFVIESRRKAPIAFLSLPYKHQGEAFLRIYGATAISKPLPHRPNNMVHLQPQAEIVYMGQCLAFRKSNKHENAYDKTLYAKLQSDQEAAIVSQRLRNTEPVKKKQQGRTFLLRNVECGIWSLAPRQQYQPPMFNSFFELGRPGKMHVGKHGMGMRCEFDAAHTNEYFRFINFDYQNISTAIVDGSGERPAVFITMAIAPKFYRSALTPGMIVAGLDLDVRADNRVRTSNLGGEHGIISPYCFVYKLTLRNANDVERLVSLGEKHGVVPMIPMEIFTATPVELFESTYNGLITAMSFYPYEIRFQLSILLSDGTLSPSTLRALLPNIHSMYTRIGAEATGLVLRAFLDDAYDAASMEPWHYGTEHTEEYLLQTLTNIEKSRLPELIKLERERQSNKNITLIHHAYISPAGVYFDGPKVETLNRVLRRYSGYHEYFLRVTFCDEDGGQVNYERGVSLDEIYLKFKLSAREILVGGRTFSFLGFSGASLRQQTCWFMAPFKKDGVLMTAASIIKDLGDFTSITNPGRCASRIGQAFSNTSSSIAIPQFAEQVIPDVQRIDDQGLVRVFSDGCGTVSKSILEMMWEGNETYEVRRPTVFQIRYAGAKGVISLDSRLQGDVLNLRPSMVKFNAAGTRTIEICSTTARPLPMYLNRPLIKILEDLGVPGDVFLELQAQQIEELRRDATDDLLAPHFLENNNISSRNLGLPRIIRSLRNLTLNKKRLSYREDEFLSHAVELGLLTVLRDIKYKARIEIPGSYTLMGCMDETGYLEEGQIFVQVDLEHRRTLKDDELIAGTLVGTVTITRAPAHHPGDVQIAQAVNVPDNSPLRQLFNCVVFSQKGFRDLPSQLSGGDLDGDLYNIIVDPKFRPKTTAIPAQYERVPEKSLGRPVQVNDMIDFFVDFMQNDSLGLISTRHLILADIHEQGTFHPDCLKIAQMASAAVDFPKTGVRVELSKLPKAPLARPDFMAPGPRLVLEKNTVSLGDRGDIIADEDDEDAADDHAYKYYPSQKILGRLYRAIDETDFLRKINVGTQKKNLLPIVFQFAKGSYEYWKNTKEESWKEFLEEARHLKEGYDEQVRILARNYSGSWVGSLEEVEVFIGCIIGKGKQNKRQKELSHDLKAEYERVLRRTIEQIRGSDSLQQQQQQRQGQDQGQPGEEIKLTKAQRDELAIRRGMACLQVAASARKEEYVSFGWIAANLVLMEIGKWEEAGVVSTATTTVASRSALRPLTNGSGSGMNGVARGGGSTVMGGVQLGNGETGLEADLQTKLRLAANRAGM